MALETLTEPLRQIVRDVAIAECRPSERRQHRRSRIAAPRPAVLNIDQRNAALVVNLGVGGMRVRALGRPVAPGATLGLQFQLPGSPEPMHTAGEVAWANDLAEAGIRFVKLSESQTGRLREWCAKNQIVNAAREFMRVAGGWQAALDLTAEVTRTLMGGSGVALTLAGGRSIHFPAEEALPVRTTVAAPVHQDERIIGHLEIRSAEFGAFDEGDLRAVSLLASMLSEMARLRAAEEQEAAPKPRLATRIVNRVEGMLPKTVRVRLVF